MGATLIFPVEVDDEEGRSGLYCVSVVLSVLLKVSVEGLLGVFVGGSISKVVLPMKKRRLKVVLV